MKRFAFIGLAALWLPLPAQAEQMHLTLQQAIEVLDALGQLSTGQLRVVKEGAQDKSVTEHYRGWSLPLIEAQAKDIVALRGPIQAYETARQQRQLDLADDQGKLNKVAQSTLAKEDKASLAAIGSYELDKFKASELLLDKNDIPPNVVANLMPLLTPEK